MSNAEHLWVMTGYAFSRPESDRRYAPLWYPGDAWVDHIGADPYNWFTCRVGISNPWVSFEYGAAAVRHFAAQHPDKGLVIAEFGSAEDLTDPDRKAQWVTDIRTVLRAPEWSQVVGLMAFHDNHQQVGSSCDWWVDSTPQSLAAYQGLIEDPLFGGDRTPAPPPTSRPPVCRATVDGQQVTIEWEDQPGTEIVRRNGSYLTSPAPGVTSAADRRPVVGDNTYVLRVWWDGTFIDHDCGTVNPATPQPPPPPLPKPPEPTPACSVAVDGAQVEVTWTDSPGREILRRDDRWRASPAAGVTSFTETVAPGSYRYVIRVWTGASSVDQPCGTAIVEDQPDAGPRCSVTPSAAGAVVSWEDFEGTVVIRRNDRWRSTPRVTSGRLDDSSLSGGTYHYTVRAWVSGGFTDVACGQITVG